MIVGVSLNLKDKRVDKMIPECMDSKRTIFYSPIKVWLFFWLLILIPGVPFLYLVWEFLWENLGINLVFILVGYYLIGYFIVGKFNTSFVVDENYVVAINPNFPWKTTTKVSIEEIIKIRFDQDKTYWILSFLGIFERNFIEIYTSKEVLKFYCFGLGVDCYDENWTEQTLDDLKIKFQELGLPTIWSIVD